MLLRQEHATLGGDGWWLSPEQFGCGAEAGSCRASGSEGCESLPQPTAVPPKAPLVTLARMTIRASIRAYTRDALEQLGAVGGGWGGGHHNVRAAALGFIDKSRVQQSGWRVGVSSHRGVRGSERATAPEVAPPTPGGCISASSLRSPVAQLEA